ncbi:hypothetical protein C9I43_05735 [Shewanella morhuae]|uniref:Uncharacterized protein n=1 Tax=Shewanella morhuae TaxID=365591 RepID=A0ABX5HT50_9GAMM|nr:hypothetical protein C9I43_05735 [Shewanella morhuae]
MVLISQDKKGLTLIIFKFVELYQSAVDHSRNPYSAANARAGIYALVAGKNSFNFNLLRLITLARCYVA